MDLLVFTNGALRDISGVNESTTCAQIVYALAHATNQKGRFVLVATFSDSEHEHRLTPNEKPYELVLKCSQKGVEVSFELRKIDSELPQQQMLNSVGSGAHRESGQCEPKEQQLLEHYHHQQQPTPNNVYLFLFIFLCCSDGS
uniref:Ras-associating domain-containing protein n=1 Tax=Ditylenchus dipsaci TaxID=166011 RepID=A0A915EJ61_9BILA